MHTRRAIMEADGGGGGSPLGELIVQSSPMSLTASDFYLSASTPAGSKGAERRVGADHVSAADAVTSAAKGIIVGGAKEMLKRSTTRSISQGTALEKPPVVEKRHFFPESPPEAMREFASTSPAMRSSLMRNDDDSLKLNNEGANPNPADEFGSTTTTTSARNFPSSLSVVRSSAIIPEISKPRAAAASDFMNKISSPLTSSSSFKGMAATLADDGVFPSSASVDLIDFSSPDRRRRFPSDSNNDAASSLSVEDRLAVLEAKYLAESIDAAEWRASIEALE